MDTVQAEKIDVGVLTNNSLSKQQQVISVVDNFEILKIFNKINKLKHF